MAYCNICSEQYLYESILISRNLFEITGCFEAVEPGVMYIRKRRMLHKYKKM